MTTQAEINHRRHRIALAVSICTVVILIAMLVANWRLGLIALVVSALSWYGGGLSAKEGFVDVLQKMGMLGK